MTLGQRHGGNNDENYKPNYLSVMNYAYQLAGVPRTGALPPYFGYSSAVLPSLQRGGARRGRRAEQRVRRDLPDAPGSARVAPARSAPEPRRGRWTGIATAWRPGPPRSISTSMVSRAPRQLEQLGHADLRRRRGRCGCEPGRARAAAGAARRVDLGGSTEARRVTGRKRDHGYSGTGCCRGGCLPAAAVNLLGLRPGDVDQPGDPELVGHMPNVSPQGAVLIGMVIVAPSASLSQ